MYEPREDSELLAKYVKKYAFGRVLDMGTGSGVLAVAAAGRRNVKRVVAVDVDAAAIGTCKLRINDKKIRFLTSDLFMRIPKREFDTIIFNPPYLPELKGEGAEVALAVAGGRRGHEVIERFLSDARGFLKVNGVILIVFSSLTGKERVESFITRNGFDYGVLEEMPLFFEKLYCYNITWQPAVAAAMKKGVKRVEYLAHGKRGMVFTGKHHGKRVAIKVKRRESLAQGRIENETRWLRRLNKKRIGPRLVFAGPGYIVYELVSGISLNEYITRNGKSDIKKIITRLLRDCFVMDELGVNKEEMHHQHKHVIVQRGKPVLIDFERCHATRKPQNVTQCVQFVCSLADVLGGKGFTFDVVELRELARHYKLKPNARTFNAVTLAIR